MKEIAMQVRSHRAASAPAQVPVLPSEEIADLVKESEVWTGMPGRCFVIHGAERLTYRVIAHPGGLEIARIEDGGEPSQCVYVCSKSFEQHPLAHAQRAGCLFTQPLSS
jgi:hypothetical protein